MILGKTNLSEWANFRSTHSIERLERARRPDAATRTRSTATPAARARASGAAVAANLRAVGVGTETDGSIVCPSDVNGARRASSRRVGLVSRAGIIPIAHSQDTAGPMARTVADAALLLGAMAGRRSRAMPRRRRRGRPRADYTQSLDADGAARRAHRRRARQLYRLQRRAPTARRRRRSRTMKRAGREIVDPANIATAAKLRRRRARGPALRVQGRSERVPRRARAERAGALAGRRDRVQRAQHGDARCRSSARSCSCGRRRRGR